MSWLVSIAGIAFIRLLAVAISVGRGAIRARAVVVALALQAALCAVALNATAVRATVRAMAREFEALMAYMRSGVEMLFNGLAGPAIGASLAINMLPVIIFFAALASVLNYLRIIPLLVGIVGACFERLIGVGRVESLCATANIFVGQRESPLVIRPYLQGPSPPALFAVMTSGMAGVAGTVLAAYAQIGIDLDYLSIASFMAAPGGLPMAKLVFPDTQGQPADAAISTGPIYRRPS